MSKIICAACKKEIVSRKELAVVGRAFIPYHKVCFKKRKGIYAFYSGYPINSGATWLLLAVINAALWAVYLLYNAPFKETLYMSLFSILLLLGFRLVSYLVYEIRLPSA
ncbi:MAG: hypothetical protein MUP09_09730 [Thiovulaceae bacterium]|nr:hypothetical protein [Sulfurimonadaceae bacterium]